MRCLTTFQVLPSKSFWTLTFIMSFFSIWKNSLSSYFLHSNSTCNTDSVTSHFSHKPVGCLPILNSVLFSSVCPILSRVNKTSSFQFLPFILPTPTFSWILQKCWHVSFLSQYCCHLSVILDFIPFPKVLRNGTLKSRVWHVNDNLASLSSTVQFSLTPNMTRPAMTCGAQMGYCVGMGFGWVKSAGPM